MSETESATLARPKILPPRNVSPFIRACRWSLLITGIFYGYFRFKYLSKKEVKIQARENKIRERRDARLAVERAEAEKKEMDMLAKEAGLVPVSQEPQH